MNSGFILIHALLVLSVAQLCLLAMFDDLLLMKHIISLERGWQSCTQMMHGRLPVAQLWRANTAKQTPLSVLDNQSSALSAKGKTDSQQGYLRHYEEPLACVRGVCFWRDTLICFNQHGQRVRWRQKITRKAISRLLD